MGRVATWIGGLLVSSVVMAAPPDWAKHDTMVRKGSMLTLVCSGSGPALDLARRSALDSCRQSAADASNSNVRIHSLSIETEHSATYHTEVSAHVDAKNLTCDVLKEESDNRDGEFTDYLKCSYDLSKASVTPVADHGPDANESSSDALSSTQPEVPSYGLAPQAKGTVHGVNRHIILSVIPACDEILVQGERPRSVPCSENPKVLLIYSGDRELIVRAVGYLPKHIDLRSSRAPAGTGGLPTAEVYLEKR